MTFCIQSIWTLQNTSSIITLTLWAQREFLIMAILFCCLNYPVTSRDRLSPQVNPAYSLLTMPVTLVKSFLAAKNAQTITLTRVISFNYEICEIFGTWNCFSGAKKNNQKKRQCLQHFLDEGSRVWCVRGYDTQCKALEQSNAKFKPYSWHTSQPGCIINTSY